MENDKTALKLNFTSLINDDKPREEYSIVVYYVVKISNVTL